MIGDLFELEDLGAQTLKGIAAPAQAYAVLRAWRIESCFEALHPEGLTALVGREEELELLTRRGRKRRPARARSPLFPASPGSASRD